MIISEDLRPISDVYVYYCSGRVTPGTNPASADFIGNWEEEGFSFLFYTRPARQAVDALLALQPQLTLLDEYHMSYADWLGEKPGVTHIGGFTIHPPWEKPAAGHGRLIALDPGVVFGTGTHSTTRDCLAAIEDIFAMGRPQSVIDLGTGTGLLALAAARLGSRRVLAVDSNILAAQTASRNVRLNRLDHVILTIQGRAEQFARRPVDLLVANIHYDILQQLITEENLARKKWFVLSGLLRSQARDVEHRLANLPVTLLRQWECEGTWFTYMGVGEHAQVRSRPEGGI
jgi:ribosomal protein L11 methyltransferase